MIKSKDTDFPLIDLAQEDQQALAQQILQALRTHGVFYAINHGFDQDYLERAFALGDAFFALPEKEKRAMTVAPENRFQGYEPPNDKDFKEAFILGPERAMDDPIVQKAGAYHGPNQWPSGLEGWKDFHLDFFDRCLNLSIRLVQLVAAAYGVDSNWIAKRTEHPMAALRILRYLPDQNRFGIDAHEDWGAISLLFQDTVPGLEKYTASGDWQLVAPQPGTCVVSAGCLLQRMTNGEIQPLLHRVINQSRRVRRSTAFFLDMDYDAVIEPFPCFENKEYPPIQVINFIEEMHQKDYAHVK